MDGQGLVWTLGGLQESRLGILLWVACRHSGTLALAHPPVASPNVPAPPIQNCAVPCHARCFSPSSPIEQPRCSTPRSRKKRLSSSLLVRSVYHLLSEFKLSYYLYLCSLSSNLPVFHVSNDCLPVCLGHFPSSRGIHLQPATKDNRANRRTPFPSRATLFKTQTTQTFAGRETSQLCASLVEAIHPFEAPPDLRFSNQPDPNKESAARRRKRRGEELPIKTHTQR
ncbi:hypothetical protein BT67DRAFT_46453 [Trichocladium antarcticum]|uniref:Uncharacterized protein n=1 Tax=Trichocladium antarcticum TaxID=1450529 RepID=A0AAN6UHV7_9PEZI|nr:hypothetical protein BT67DRAFT_46453 [Trichocladium antarcticum]